MPSIKPPLGVRLLGLIGLRRSRLPPPALSLPPTAYGLPPPAQRSYDAAQVSRLFDDWITPYTTGDAELRGTVRRLIARMRDLARNNDYVRGYLGDLCSNVIGSHRFDLRMDVHDLDAAGAKKPDRRANLLIEQGWARWSTRRHASPSKARSWRTLKRQAIRSVARDGAVLVRHIRGAAAKNPFNYAVQLIEIDQLDLDKHENLPDGRIIRFGIEKTADGETLAYHIYASHPGDDLPRSATSGREILRIPASEMFLLQLDDRITETLAVSWFVSCATRLKHLGGYEEAEVIAARVGACKGGFFKKSLNNPNTYAGDTESTAPHTVDMEPGHMEELPAGLEFQSYDPTHPNTAFGDFRKAMLRGIGVALGCSYTTLGNDLESVNYSSARVGILDEREVWKELQAWFAEDFLEVVFGEWLLMALTSGALGGSLPLSKLEKFTAPVFKARRWAWVDPLKDLKAAELGIALRTTSRRQIIDDNGGDVEDVFAANRDDEQLAADLGLSLTPPDPTPAGSTFEDQTPPDKKAGAGRPGAEDEDEATAADAED